MMYKKWVNDVNTKKPNPNPPRVVASELQLILEAELEKVMWKYCVGKGSECKTDLQCDGEKKCEYVPIGA